jgi:hypothetical protein
MIVIESMRPLRERSNKYRWASRTIGRHPMCTHVVMTSRNTATLRRVCRTPRTAVDTLIGGCSSGPNRLWTSRKNHLEVSNVSGKSALGPSKVTKCSPLLLQRDKMKRFQTEDFLSFPKKLEGEGAKHVPREDVKGVFHFEGPCYPKLPSN